MNIVVLDGYTTNPGDLDWSELQSLGHTEIYDRTLPHEIIERARNAEIVLTNKVVLSKEIISQLPNLRYIGVLATGYNIIDIDATKTRSIVVTNIPAYGTMSVAQLTFSLLLELTNRVGHHAAVVKIGKWSAKKDFSFWDFPLTELAKKTFGIIGFGNIGQAVAKIASGFGMNIIISTRSPEKHKIWQDSETSRIIFSDTETLFKSSDVISLHCALNDETKNIINQNSLNLMKRSAFLINTSRGGLIDEQALVESLNNEKIAGAGLDVLSVEPPPNDHPLLTAKNCIVTPHYAWGTKETRTRLMNTAVENIRAFLNKKPINVIY